VTVQERTLWKHTHVKNDNLTLMLLQIPLKIPFKKQFINLLIKRYTFLYTCTRKVWRECIIELCCILYFGNFSNGSLTVNHLVILNFFYLNLPDSRVSLCKQNNIRLTKGLAHVWVFIGHLSLWRFLLL